MAVAISALILHLVQGKRQTHVRAHQKESSLMQRSVTVVEDDKSVTLVLTSKGGSAYVKVVTNTRELPVNLRNFQSRQR